MNKDPEIVELLLKELPRFTAQIDAAAMEKNGGIPASLRRASAEFGLFSLSIDEEFGGVGLGLDDCSRVITELAKVDASFATCIGLHAGLGTRGLALFGSEELKKTWLPKMASGECIGSFCGTEPNAGSDLMSVRTQVRKEGDLLKLNGEKSYVTNSAFSGMLTVLTNSPDHGGKRCHTVVCVPRERQGIRVSDEEKKLGLKASSTRTVFFDDVLVDPSELLLPNGGGMAHAHEILTWGRSLMSAGCLGVAKKALSMTASYVQQRRQFGKAIAQYDIVRSQISWMASRTFAMNAIVRHTARVDDGGYSIESLSTVCKIFCSEASFQICDIGVQLHGAMGFMEETGIARLLRDCRVTRIFEGANDVLLAHLGVAVMANAEGAQILLRKDSAPESSKLTSYEKLLDASERQAAAIAEIKNTLGIRVMRQQLMLKSIAQAHIALTVASLVALADTDAAELALADHAIESLLIEHSAALESLGRADGESKRNRQLSAQVYEMFVDA